ncbi:MAG: ABC transporter ATP-binding protein [Lachnospiraceae bacterium]|nr:ABC transporter ATP-binding protein [Lachnospiraceae bacterium]
MGSVTLKHLVKSFGESTVVNDLDEVIRDGEFVTLLGPSGCGKTTILRMIAGFEKPTSGEIWFDDVLICGGKTFVPPEKRGIGMVFQSYAVWPHMTVYDNVAYPLTIKKVSKEETKSRVRQALSLMHLEKYAERLPSQLSGGQQQRVALARALVAEPQLLLLDEPLSNLDAKLRESMRFEIKRLQKALGITVIYVTHDQTEAMAMSDRIFVLNRGGLQQAGTPEEVYNKPANPFVADFLGKVEFFKGEAEPGRIVLPELSGESIAYAGDLRGKVYVAVRPENLLFSADGELYGTLEAQYYMGDVDDCRVRIGETLVRVITDGYAYKSMTAGQEVRLSVRDYIIYEDDGSLEETLEIRT